MKYSLRETIKDFRQRGAIGHFNTSNISQLKSMIQASIDLNTPIVVGVSEGEREFWGVKEIANLIKTIRNELNIPIFLNADHTHSFEKIKEAVEAGFDTVLFDGSKENVEKNIADTIKVVEFVKDYNDKNGTDILVEGEIGYIGSGSEILNDIPTGAEIDENNITKPDEAKNFVEKTGVDMLAPAVGNIHGMFKNAPNPHLYIERIKEIAIATGVPLVLHGGSGIRNEDFVEAIKAGISMVHISTKLRVAWRRGVEESLRNNPNEVAPYKILSPVVDKVKDVVKENIEIFTL